MKPSEIAKELLGGMLFMFLIGLVCLGLYVISPSPSEAKPEILWSEK